MQVRWMTVEFDPRSLTSQPEDIFTATLPGLKQPLFGPLTRAPDKIFVVPGNQLELSMQSVSNYIENVPRYAHPGPHQSSSLLRDDPVRRFGFSCHVTGFSQPYEDLTELKAKALLRSEACCAYASRRVTFLSLPTFLVRC